MIRISGASQELRIQLLGAVTTSELDAVAAWADKTVSDYAGGANAIQSNGTVITTLVAPPGASVVRDVDFLNITNRDTAEAGVLVFLYNGVSNFLLMRATLSQNDQLTYTHGGGWHVLDGAGKLKSGPAINVQDEGSLLGARPTLNFIGAGVTAVDNPGNDRVDITIPGGGSAILGWGAENIGSSAETRVLPSGYVAGLVDTQTPKGFRVPRAGTIQNLTARHNNGVGNGSSVTYTLRINGTPTAVSVTLATAVVGSARNAVNSVVVAQDDLVEMLAIKLVGIGNGTQYVFCSAEFL